MFEDFEGGCFFGGFGEIVGRDVEGAGGGEDAFGEVFVQRVCGGGVAEGFEAEVAYFSPAVEAKQRISPLRQTARSRRSQQARSVTSLGDGALQSCLPSPAAVA